MLLNKLLLIALLALFFFSYSICSCFSFILSNTKVDCGVKVAEELRKQLHRLKIIHSQFEVSNYVPLSLGVSSIIPHQELSPSVLMNTADEALYNAKNQGRDRVVQLSVISYQ
ncbi:MAG: diguanylate cyclase [Moorea sp. SIO2B7]|nr:diguanylate cyclase [Moorena sp. SIO2B7]